MCTVGYRTGYWTNGSAGAGGTNLFRGRRVVVNSPYLQTTTLVNTLFGANLYCGGEQPLHPTTNLVNTLFGARTINFLVRAL